MADGGNDEKDDDKDCDDWADDTQLSASDAHHSTPSIARRNTQFSRFISSISVFKRSI